VASSVANPVANPDPAAVPAPKATAAWICSTPPLAQPLTVGQLFEVSCEGPSVSFQAGKLFLIPAKENAYALRLLKIREVTPASGAINKVNFVATTYVASEKGPLPVSGYMLSDGTQSVSLSPLQLQSKSVITQDKNPERKPFGPFAPLTIAYPLWLWLFLAVVAAAFAAAIGYVLYRRVQRKKFLAELAGEISSLSPYNQFNKELRALGRMGVVTEQRPWSAERAKEMLAMLQSAINWYIAREFQIPAHRLATQSTLKSLSRLRARHLGPRFQSDEKEVATVLRELVRALKKPASVSLGEIQQLAELGRQSVERLNKWPFTRASSDRKAGVTT
jgi:hypothetical protein